MPADPPARLLDKLIVVRGEEVVVFGRDAKELAESERDARLPDVRFWTLKKPAEAGGEG